AAEAAVQEVFYTLQNNATYRDNPAPLSGSVGGANYTVTVAKANDTYTLSATGYAGGITRAVSQSVRVSADVPEILYDALYADGALINFRNVRNAVINGNVTTGGSIRDAGNVQINGVVSPDTPLDVPAVDYSSYYARAQAAGQAVSGNKVFTAGTYDGVWYVTGRVTFWNNVVINGTVVAEGRMILRNARRLRVTAASPDAALLTQGAVNAQGLRDSTINGVVYAQDTINLRNSRNNVMNGSLISGNRLLFQNSRSWRINYDDGVQSGVTGLTAERALLTPQHDWSE
ncbi:MAG: hypothetical protein MJA29_10995, partial [Candidatus Omnitrophica bacterium]|nr:hypothetical protein [Candidatus Omnitrophota bacterium]